MSDSGMNKKELGFFSGFELDNEEGGFYHCIHGFHASKATALDAKIEKQIGGETNDWVDLTQFIPKKFKLHLS